MWSLIIYIYINYDHTSYITGKKYDHIYFALGIIEIYWHLPRSLEYLSSKQRNISHSKNEIFLTQTKKYVSLKQRNISHSLTKSHLTLPREWVKTVMFPEMMPVVELPIDKLSRSAPLSRRTQTFTWGRNTSDSTEKYFSLKEEIPINWLSSRSIFIWPRQGTE